MICRDDLPPTPDWIPETRDRTILGAECPAFVSQPLTWDGDNA